MHSLTMSPFLSLSSFAAPACLSIGAGGAFCHCPFLSSSFSSSTLCPFFSLYVSIPHDNQHVERESVAQAWDWACGGWTEWELAGSCGSHQLITAQILHLYAYVVLQIHNHISITVISESRIFCTLGLRVFYTFAKLWALVWSHLLLSEKNKCSCWDVVFFILFCLQRFSVSSKSVREGKYSMSWCTSHTHCDKFQCVFLSRACLVSVSFTKPSCSRWPM